MGISRVFVANRGEIAVRIVRACHKLGLEAVVGFSEPDRESLAVQMADRALCIGPGSAAQSYLSPERLITAALGTGCDALHPGYGFLAENAAFAELCTQHGLVFVGPDAVAIRAMGNKLEARALALAQDVPLAPGSVRITDPTDARARAAEIGFPLLFKAAAGGGGRGIRIVTDAQGLGDAYAQASAEAQAAFSDNALFMERYITDARHVEVQILGDHHGTIVHLGERDCSLQRRFQKVIEEAPSVHLPADMRAQMRAAAVRLARHIGYVSAGTVEFIVDMQREEFFFLEMNTRLQVEHPVTEMITGVDIVAEQLRVAGGAPLSFAQEDLALDGHAIECRINAEAPARGFAPAPGRITLWQPPEGPGIRMDSHAFLGWMVSPYYDSLVGKLIITAPDRAGAVRALRAALGRFRIEGLETNLNFLRRVVEHPDFAAGTFNTKWLEHNAPHLIEAAA
jgi:acetyl-CoA carboxylase, biotin carboxylase subunit